MSGWLDDVLGVYLDTVTEREFDATFLALLRALRYTDIHLTHGPYEFGKDVIAKRDGYQWCFQTKAGNIDLGSWRTIRSQVEEMLWNNIAHPQFDASMRRRAVLVTTGRLVGGAAADAQQYVATLQQRGLPAAFPPFESWDRETILESLVKAPDLSLNGWSEEPLHGLLGLLHDTASGSVSLQQVERASRSWSRDGLARAALAASVAANCLQRGNRLDLACSAALCLTRVAAIEAHPQMTPEALATMEIARKLYEAHASEFVGQVRPFVADARALFLAGSEMPGSVTYAVRCSAICETLGMFGLLRHEEGDTSGSAEIATVLAEFVAANAGAAHPVSDRWALSIVPAAVLLYRNETPTLELWLERIVGWICDRHERAPGLASVYADPADEVRHLLGDAYEHVDLRRRKQSYLATIVLDLACCLEMPDLFRDAHNDFLAVDLAFPVLEPLDEVGQYVIGESGVVVEANVGFDEDHDFSESWKAGVHHKRGPDSYALERVGRSWELLGVSLLLRDRHVPGATRRLAGLAPRSSD